MQPSDLAATIAGVPQAGLRCSGCHGRDASGTFVGSADIPPVDGPTLSTATAARPGYDARLFDRALRDGLRSDGRPLAIAMPRYALDEAQTQALWQFLSEVETDERRGVGPESVRFAVVAGARGQKQADAFRMSLERAWARLALPGVNGRHVEFVSISNPPAADQFDDVFAVLGGERGPAGEAGLLGEIVARGIPVVGPAFAPSRAQERLSDVVWLTRGESAVSAFISQGAVSRRGRAGGQERHVVSRRDLEDVLSLSDAELANVSLVVSAFAVQTPGDLGRLAETRADTFLVRPAAPFRDREEFADLIARLLRDGLAGSGRDLTRTRFLEEVGSLASVMPDPAGTSAGSGPISADDFDVIQLMPPR